MRLKADIIAVQKVIWMEEKLKEDTFCEVALWHIVSVAFAVIEKFCCRLPLFTTVDEHNSH